MTGMRFQKGRDWTLEVKIKDDLPLFRDREGKTEEVITRVQN